MNAYEWKIISRLARALSVVPGVSNPTATKAMVLFHYDTKEVRCILSEVLWSLLDTSGDTKGNRRKIRKQFKELDEFITRRNREGWQEVTAPYKYS